MAVYVHYVRAGVVVVDDDLDEVALFDDERVCIVVIGDQLLYVLSGVEYSVQSGVFRVLIVDVVETGPEWISVSTVTTFHDTSSSHLFCPPR